MHRFIQPPNWTRLLGLVVSLVTLVARAENWPQWRGPNFNGATTERNLPVKFNKTENVLWTAPMPGPSAATPIVWNDHVFISSVDSATRTCHAMAFDRRTGRKLWSHEAAPRASQDDRSNYASPSPATDGERVVFFYGSGELVAYNFSGKQLWARNIQKDYGSFAFMWTFSTSPLLFDDKLYLQVLQRDKPVNGRGRSDGPNESYLLALDPATGKEMWRHVRPADAREESLEAFSTPTPFTYDGRTELLIVGGDCISGHVPSSGAELWRWGTWNPTRIGHWRLVPSPVGGGGVVLACAPKGSPVFAIKAGGQGALTDVAIAWKSEGREISADVSTPLFYGGRFYILNSDKKTLACVEPASGKVIWNGDLASKAKFESSPTGADGRIYMMNFKGEVFVAATGDEFKVLHVAALGDESDTSSRSTVAAAQGQLFVRTAAKLYCVGRKD